MDPKRKLTDILNDEDCERIDRMFERGEAAPDDQPIPRGMYVARIAAGELHTAKTGTKGYRLTFEIVEGEHTGRRLWHHLWLTAAAEPRTLRGLQKIGVTSREELERPIPPGIVCELTVVVHCDDDGIEENVIRAFKMLRFDPPAPDEFAPADNRDPDDAGDATAQAEATTTDDDEDASFDPAKLEDDDGGDTDSGEAAADNGEKPASAVQSEIFDDSDAAPKADPSEWAQR